MQSRSTRRRAMSATDPVVILSAIVVAGAMLGALMARGGRSGRSRDSRGFEGWRGRDEAAGAGRRRRGTRLAAVAPQVAEDAAGTAEHDFVRPAGPEAMRDAPRRDWSQADEISDESFPASDPPATY